MWFGILGRLEVRRTDGTAVPLLGPARRQLLAALLCRSGAAVSASTLIDDLWGPAAPRSALSSLRSHAARLRADLGRDQMHSMLVTEGDGYRITLGADDLDSKVFERLLHEAARHADPVAAIATYDAALALWRDEAYAEFGQAPFAVAERVRLAELRSSAQERRTDLALNTGPVGDLIGELEHRVRTQPYRERGWEQLALALYRDGRQADALGACRRARQVLVGDLGVDPGPGLRELEIRLLQQDPALLPVPPPRPRAVLPQVCPYQGLAGYAEHDAAMFVGRERLTAELAGRLADQSVVVLVGASGVGKSSLVRAGLIPALRAGALPGSSTWRVDVGTPASGTGLGDPARRRPDLVVLDQAEELFSGAIPHGTDALEALHRYVEHDEGRLLLVVRSDFYPRLAEVDQLALFARKTAVFVGPLRADELRRALVEPAASVGLRLESDLLETILEDVAGQTEPLPLLSQAMVRTWRRRQGDLLTLEAYRLAGEVAGALEAAAEECFASLGEQEARAARRLLLRMAVRTPTGWIRTPIDPLGPDEAAEQAALTALVGARLVVVFEHRIEIAHDALLVRWPRMREWLDERSLAADLLRHLHQAAAAWQAASRVDTDLYRGARLSTALEWRAEHPADLSAAEVQFLDASRSAAEEELEAARAQTRREASGRRRLRSVALVLAVVVVLAAAAAVVATRERGSAQQSATRAEHSALAADARRLAALSAGAPDIATSSLLAVAAYRLLDSPDSRGALLTAVERNQSALWRIQFPHRLLRIAATPDGSRLAISDNRNRVTVVDPRRRAVLTSFAADGQLEGIVGGGRQVVVSAPNQGAAPGGRLEVDDLVSGKVVRTLTDAVDQDNQEPVTSSNGRWIAALTTHRAGAGSTVAVFDADNWAAGPRQFATTVAAVSLSVTASAVAVERADGAVDVRALPALGLTGRLPAVPGVAAGPAALALSPDDRTVARVDPAEPRRVQLYRIGGGGAGTPLPLQPQAISNLTFAPDGSELAVASYSGSLALYRTDNGAPVGSLTGQAGPLLGSAWTGGAAPTALYTVGLDSQLVSWDLDTGPRTVQETGPDRDIPGHAELFGSLVIGDVQPPNTPDSHRRLFTTALGTGTTVSWPAGLRDDEDIGQVVASADGRRAVVSITGISGKDLGVSRIEIVDLHTHRDIGRLALPAGTSTFADGLTAAVSPDAQYAYAALGNSRIGVFALPSGRYLRDFTVRYAGADAGRIVLDPWQFDPAGHLVLVGYDPGPADGSTSPAGQPQPPDQRLGLLDVSTGQLIAQARLGDVTAPSALAWSHDGRTLAVGTYDGTLTFRDAGTLAATTGAGTVTSGYVSTVSFAPDDASVVIGGTDGTARFIGSADGVPEGTPVPIGNGANNGGVFAWFSPGGDVVGFAQDQRRSDTDQQRWFTFRAGPGALAATACALAGADITPAQWQRYVSDLPYRHVCPSSR